MGKNSAPQGNSMGSMLTAMAQMQMGNRMADLGQNWLDFSKEQFGISNDRQKVIDELTKRVTDQQLSAGDLAMGWAKEDRERYKSIFQPLQDKFIEKANNWDSPQKQAEAAAEARADVSSAAAAQDQIRQRAMAAQGINPASGRWAGVDRAADTGTALAAAGAQNVARRNLRTEAMGLQGQAINIGNGLPAQASGGLGQSGAMGSAAVGNTIAGEQPRMQSMSIMNSGFGGAMNGYQGALNGYTAAGNTMQKAFENSMATYNANNAQGAGMLGGLGSIAGLMFGGSKPWFLSDENAKEEKREVRGVLDALKKIPVEAWKYKEGQGDEQEHVGAYAQDFTKATGLGDGKTINIIDALGVTMGAVKELAEKVEASQGKRDGDERRAPARRTASRPTKGRSIMMKEAA